MSIGWYPPILTYHRIHPTPASDTPTLSPAIFEQQMKILATRWKPIPLLELVAWLEGKSPYPAKGVVVTFDDGTEDTYTHAFPILSRHRIPATVFLIADHVGKPSSLNPDQLRVMGQAGVTFGSHTSTHAYLPELSIDQIRDELQTSKRLLEDRGFSIEFLSYPAGGFTQEIIQAVREAGYRAACTTNRGRQRFSIDRWALRRITMHGRLTSSFGMWLRCGGFYGLNRRLRPPA